MRRLPKGLVSSIPRVPDRVSMANKRFILSLRKEGCANRPFYKLVLTKSSWPVRKYIDPIEQVGTFDPMPNCHGEKLAALNIERILYLLSEGVEVQDDAAELLGLAGLLPVHPNTYRNAWRNRKEFNMEKLRKELEEAEAEEETSSEGTRGSEEAGNKT